MNIKHFPVIAFATTVAAALAPGSAAAVDRQMVDKLARDTGLAPVDVVLVLGDNLPQAECNYYAHPSGRGHMARLVAKAHARSRTASSQPDASGRDSVASVRSGPQR